MQPVLVNVSDISQWVARLWWPVLRVGGFVASAPVASEATIPGPVKIALSLGFSTSISTASRPSLRTLFRNWYIIFRVLR